MSTERSEQVIDTCCTTVHTLGRQNAKKEKSLRYMQKDGKFPVMFQQAPGDWITYWIDIFTSLVEIRWRMMFLIFSLNNIVSWLLFGLCYWLIAHVNGDNDNADDDLCVSNVRDFTGAFLFSMETGATIGYGYRHVTENSIVAIILVTIQIVFSCILDTVVIGVVVAKMASARKRAQTVGFSRCAVVNLRDRVLCLSWRLGDFRGNHILEGVVSVQLIRYVKRPVGSIVITYQDLDIEEREIVLATPTTIIHKLEPGSPLYNMGPDDLMDNHFELVVSFTYTGDSTGILHQTRASYTSADIRWGQRFQDMLKMGKKHYKLDYSLFNVTTWVPVPFLSAEEYDRRGRPADGTTLLPIGKRNRHIAQVNLNISEEMILQTFL
ncbi:inward rectifier potassium channel 16 [Oreochromis niloticus]|uniref:Potassium inwardly rectifying channel subfamily J member 16 n=1 Tax=Oreochromis niloticus TaxID=8128 RepID=A0A669E5Y7_ORENI|nr:inward rectifier potassium channel 16 [Oreochromis niloticus]XP_025762031.1 inward rectifier potassium channel 16 [Oreochromis niloticus]XP_025762032.1 inward rectifier potassium channel 16 [Oreochromis niloticus]